LSVEYHTPRRPNVMAMLSGGFVVTLAGSR
jgi:hypothetical protein